MELAQKLGVYAVYNTFPSCKSLTSRRDAIYMHVCSENTV